MTDQYRRVLIFLFFISFLFTGLRIFPDYGISIDEAQQREIGLYNYKYIIEGDRSVSSFKNKDYGPVFELFLISIEKLFHLEDSREIYLMRHLCTFLLFFFGVLFFYLLCQNYFNDWKISLLGVLFLILSPRIFAHSFYNSKDIPFLSLFIISIYFFTKLIEEKTIPRAFIHALVSAMLINIRIIGILVPFFTIIFIGIDSLKLFKESNKKNYSPFKEGFKSLIVYFLLLIFFVILFWPFLWVNPLNNFMYVLLNMSKFRWEWDILYLGEQIKSTNIPWHYIPVWLTITTPVLYIAGFIAGMLIIVVRLIKNPLQYFFDNQKKKELIFILWFFMPLLALMMLHSVLYDAWRHMFFIYPAFLIISLIGLKHLMKFIKSKIANPANIVLKYLLVLSIVVSLFSTSKFMIKNHPHQNYYFNMLAGEKTQHPHHNFELDYWGLSYRQALEFILENDTSKSINIKFANNHEFPEMILTRSARNRLKYTGCDKAKYFISNYRFSSVEYPLKNEFYSLNIDGYKIMVVYKLKEEVDHENRIKYHEKKMWDNKRFMEIISQKAKNNETSLEKMIKSEAIKIKAIEDYVLKISCSNYWMKIIDKKSKKSKIEINEIIWQTATSFYDNEKEKGIIYPFD